MTKISVFVEEGRVKAVEGIPIDLSVEVKNYDVDHLDKNGCQKTTTGGYVKFGSGMRQNK